MITLNKSNIKAMCLKWFNVVATDPQVNAINKEVEKYLNTISDDVICAADLADIIGDIVL